MIFVFFFNYERHAHAYIHICTIYFCSSDYKLMIFVNSDKMRIFLLMFNHRWCKKFELLLTLFFRLTEKATNIFCLYSIYGSSTDFDFGNISICIIRYLLNWPSDLNVGSNYRTYSIIPFIMETHQAEGINELDSPRYGSYIIPCQK